jgi:hypothetical protein
MARLPTTQLKGIYGGADIWVIASGPSAGFVDPGFFDGRITIGVNRVWTRFTTRYLVIKEQSVLPAALDAGPIVIASHHHCGNLNYVVNKAKTNGRSYYFFEHANNEVEQPDLSVIGTDKIIVSFSTITSAMHLAAYMGAANILLVGHDCGSIDGKINFDEYPENLMKSEDFYRDFLSRIEPQTRMVKAKLMEVYGCRVYSLNPWINFGLEDHDYGQEKS